MSLSNPREGRDQLVDAIRGVCIVSMLIVHLCARPLSMRISISGTIGFLSAAEGFFFLSGMVFAKVYGTRFRVLGVKTAERLTLKRWMKFYLLQVLCILAMVIAALAVPDALVAEDDQFQLAVRSPVEALWRGALLVYYPSHLGILPMYLLCMPVASLLLRQGWAGRNWVPASSILLWLLQSSRDNPLRDATTIGIFSPFGYQVLYFVGLWFGAQPDESRLLNHRRWFWTSLTIALACFLALHPRLILVPGSAVSEFRRITEWPLDKTSLGWLRVVSFGSVAYLIYYFRERLRALPLGILAALGRHSLAILIGHILFFLAFCQLHANIRRASVAVYNGYMLVCITLTVLAVWGLNAQMGHAGARKHRGPRPGLCAKEIGPTRRL